MKFEAKVENPEATVIKMTITMTMAEWECLRPKLENWGDQEKWRCKIWNMQRAMEKVVRAEEDPAAQ